MENYYPSLFITFGMRKALLFIPKQQTIKLNPQQVF